MVANSVSSMTLTERSPPGGDFGERRVQLKVNQDNDWLGCRLRVWQQKTISAIVFARVSEKEIYVQISEKV